MTRTTTVDNIWASGGSVVDPGTAKVNSGWAAEIPALETQNFWQNRVDELLQDIELHGIMQYSSVTVYGIGAWVTASDNEIYKSITSSNSGNDPISSPVNWTPFSTIVAVQDATESVKGIVELSSLAETQVGTDDTRAVSPKNLKDALPQLIPDASTATKGKVELASNAETQTGADAVRAVTPAGLKSVTASETRAGLVERATDAEVTTGTDTTRYISPKQFVDNVDALVPTATTSVVGKVELATATEVRVGTDSTRAVTPSTMGSFMTGWIMPFPATVAPSGFLEAKGQLVSRTGTYAELWTWVQTNMRVVTDAAWNGNDQGTYSSGDGSTTFRIPDLRGEFIRGYDHGRGVDSGRTVGTTQSDEFQSHNHSVTAGRWIGGYTDDGGAPDQRMTQQTFNSTSVGSSETRPRNIAMMYCIKV